MLFFFLKSYFFIKKQIKRVKILKYNRLTYINNTLFIGKVVIHLPRLDSTNKFAIDFISKNKPSEGTVISTDNQQEGRGQIGSVWESQAYKNITLSVILYPKFLNVREQFALNRISSIAVFRLIKEYLPKKEVKIKWPNDIYVGHRKIAGILIQNAIHGQGIQSSVIGLGININQKRFYSNAPNPTSLQLESGENFKIKQLSAALCEYLEEAYLKLKQQQYEELDQFYQYHLYQRNVSCKFVTKDNEIFEGKIKGVDPSGRLCIKKSGELVYFNFKEVSFA